MSLFKTILIVGILLMCFTPGGALIMALSFGVLAWNKNLKMQRENLTMERERKAPSPARALILAQQSNYYFGDFDRGNNSSYSSPQTVEILE